MAITLTLLGAASKAQSVAGQVEITLTQAVPAGKVIALAAFATSTPVLTGITDDKSNSYTILSGVNVGASTGYWAHAVVSTGLAIGDKITGAFSSTTSRRFLVAIMVDGAAASYIDAQGVGQTGTSNNPSINTGPQAEAGEMVLSWLFVVSPAVTVTEDADWTFIGEPPNADGRKFHVAAKEMATTAADLYEPLISASQSWSANWLALKAASAPSGYTLTAAAGALALTGRAAAVRATRKLPIAARSFTLAGINAAIRKGYRVRADLRGYGLTGIAARVARGLRLGVSVQAFTLTGIAATLARTAAGRSLSAATGAFALTGRAAGVKPARRLRAPSEGYTWARLAAGLRWSRRMVAGAAGFTLAGQPIGWGWTHILKPRAAGYAMTGQAATLRYSGGQGWQPVPGTPETWNPKASKSETWTPVGDTPEIWS